MTRLRVAVVLSGGELFSPYWGGAVARWTYEVYRRLTSSIEFVVFGDFTPTGTRYALPFESASFQWLPKFISKLPYVRRSHDRVWLQRFARRLQDFDIVHLQNRPHWAPLLRQAGYEGRIIGHLHNGHLAHWSGAELDRLSKTLDCIASCSNFIASTFTGRSQAVAAKSVVVYNGVDLNVFDPAEAPRADKQVFFVGRFSEQKGVLPLVESFESVFRRHRDAQLVIGGSSGFGTHQESDYVRKVRSKADQLIKEGADIKFTGYIDHYRQLPDYFRQASIAVFPSVFEEPFGMVLCEAMACGTPVVASARGGIPEVLGDAGRLTEPEPTRLASDLLEVIENRALRNEMSRMGIERVRKFSWENAAERWRSILQAVAARSSLSNFAGMTLDSAGHRHA